MSAPTSTIQPKAPKYGVLATTVLGSRYIAATDSRETADAIAEEARASGRYLKVRVN